MIMPARAPTVMDIDDSRPASATLVGLMFVAVSIGAAIFNEDHSAALAAFITPTVTHFAATLFTCLLVTSWMREQGLLDPARFVFVDETAVTTNIGLSQRSELTRRTPLWRFSDGALGNADSHPGFRRTGIVAPTLIKRAMNGEAFLARWNSVSPLLFGGGTSSSSTTSPSTRSPAWRRQLRPRGGAAILAPVFAGP
jgi:hypothetical protein